MIRWFVLSSMIVLLGSAAMLIPVVLASREIRERGHLIDNLAKDGLAQREKMNELHSAMKNYAETYVRFVEQRSGIPWDAGREPCVPHPEICNGIDDDCDGVVDEILSNGKLVSICPRIDFEHRSFCLMREWKPGPDGGGTEESAPGEPLPEDAGNRSDPDPFNSNPDAIRKIIMVHVSSDCNLVKASVFALREDETVAFGAFFGGGSKEIDMRADFTTRVDPGDVLRLQIKAFCSTGVGKTGLEKCIVPW